MSAMNINKNNFHEEVLKSEKPVLVDFWAPWCGPCRMVGPILDEIADERPDIKVGKVNIDEEFELARQFGISSIRLVAAAQGVVIPANMWGKVKTFSTMVGLCVMMAFPQVSWIGAAVMVVIVATTLYSGVEYFIQNWNCLWD